MPKKGKIYLGADHAGFRLKENIKKYLKEMEVEYEDLGAKEFNENDDYPDYALLVAQKTAKTKKRGILICSSGIGVCITANKVPEIRAVRGDSIKTVKDSRTDEDSNILCLGQKYITSGQAKKIIDAWLKTDFSEEERHLRRLEKIEKIEKNNI